MSTENDAQSVEKTVAALLRARVGVLNSSRALRDIAGRLMTCEDPIAQNMGEQVKALMENADQVANLLEIHRTLAANGVLLSQPVRDREEDGILYQRNGSGSGGSAVLRRWLRPTSKQAS